MKKRLLIIGPGDVAARALPRLAAGFDVLAMARTPQRAAQLMRNGVRTAVGDLDQPQSLGAAIQAADFAADCVLHCAPPAESGARDERTRHLLAALDEASQKARGMVPRRIAYVSTSGVYGDCRGARVDESRPVNPATARARRRCDAEAALSQWCSERGVQLVILRAPGIYAADRLPLERVRRGMPVFRREDDVYTNHIHADDLAAICVAALHEGAAAGVFNASDDSDILMGDWMDLLADSFGLSRPPRMARAEAAGLIPAETLSFMSESRRLVNARLKRDLGYALRYPTVRDGVRAAQAA